MIREDYLMRHLRQFTQILAQVLLRKKNGAYEQALEDIQLTGQNLLEIDLHAIEAITYEGLQNALRVHKITDAPSTALVAELLLHQGDCFAEIGQTEAATQSRTLALHLYLDLYTSGKWENATDHLPTIDALLNHFPDPFVLDPDTQHLLFRYLDATGHYARAEDVLFHLAAARPNRTLYNEGYDFFQRLLRTPYRRLKAGNLPYEEVREGFETFKEQFSSTASD
ncbi:MAG TPA: DUF6483 family protein [Rhodothermales bacterium]|nr:DUF6483 family protein [Rhodothermales bacterium]